MRKFIVYATVVVVVFGIGNRLGAEPSSSVRHLMNQPMSIFDWGLFRLQRDLQEDLKFDQTKEIRPSKAYVGYTSKANAIEIALFAYPKQNFVKEVPAKDICKNVANYVRRFLDADAPKHVRAYTGITKYFESSTFAMQHEKFMDDIETITRVKVNVGGSETDKPQTKTLAECNGPLLGEVIIFKAQ